MLAPEDKTEIPFVELELKSAPTCIAAFVQDPPVTQAVTVPAFLLAGYDALDERRIWVSRQQREMPSDARFAKMGEHRHSIDLDWAHEAEQAEGIGTVLRVPLDRTGTAHPTRS